MSPRDPIWQMLAKDRKKGITVIGAISELRESLFYHVYEDGGTCIPNVLHFLKRLVKSFDDPTEVVLVWDRHSAHMSEAVTTWIEGEGIDSFPLPPHSSNLNRE